MSQIFKTFFIVLFLLLLFLGTVPSVWAGVIHDGDEPLQRLAGDDPRVWLEDLADKFVDLIIERQKIDETETRMNADALADFQLKANKIQEAVLKIAAFKEGWFFKVGLRPFLERLHARGVNINFDNDRSSYIGFKI